MLEVHISHFIEALTEKKTKAPMRGMYVKLQKVWPAVKNEIDKMEEPVKFTSKTRHVVPLLDHPCTNLAVKLCSLGRALTWETFSRGDYKKLCQLFVF